MTTMTDPLIDHQLGDYRIAELIGRGGMGRVYRASDPAGSEIALKVLALDEIDDLSEISRFDREVQMVSSLHHENIVSAYTSGRAAGYLYMAMELVHGTTLREQLRSGHKPELNLALAVAAQVLAALEYAHQHGVVHRDIKPENVLLTADGHAKVLDFGVAKLDSATALTRANEVLGTIEYMAPEQILGETPTPAIDLYALGVLLYEMLTGRLPFAGESPATLVYHQLNEEAPAPSSLNPNLPRPLDRLVLRLLDKEPDNRPASAAQARFDLEEIIRQLQMTDLPIAALDQQVDQDPEQELRTRHFRPRFVGRQAESDALHNHFDALAAGGRLVLLSGEAGVGKTRMIEELRRYAARRGGRLVQGTCFFEHGMGPFVPILDALAALFTRDDHIGQEQHQTLVEALIEIAPELFVLVDNPSDTAKMRIGFSAGFASEQDPDQARQRFFDAIFELLATAARQQPLVVVLEDVHWADEGTQQLLHYLSRRAVEAPLLCLATYRPEEMGDRQEAPLIQIISQLASEDLLHQLHLDRLDRDAVDQLARSLFLEAEFSSDFGDFLHEQSQGSPFIAVEVLKLLRQQQVIYCESGVWTAHSNFAETVIPDRVNALVMRRLDQLDDELRELVELAAVLGPRFASRLLEKASGMGRIPLLKALFRLEKKHRLISSADGDYAFAHSKIREVLYAEIPPELRVEYHRIAAAVLSEGDQQQIDDAELGRHLYHAGEWEQALPYLQRAGQRAFGMFNWRSAAALLAQVASACRQHDAVPQELLRALCYQGLAHERLGAFEQSLDIFTDYERVAETLGDREAQSEAWVYIGRVRESLRRFTEATIALNTALELADEQHYRVRGLALMNLGSLQFEQGNYQEAESHWSQALELLRQAKVPQAINALNNLAVLATVRGDFERAWNLYEEVLALDGDEPKPQTVLTYQNMGMLRADQQRWSEALELYARALELCQITRTTSHEPTLELNRGEALLGRGDLAAARETCAQALRGFRRSDDALGLADALRLYGQICRLEGNWDEGSACLERSIELNRSFGETISLGEALCELGLLYRDQGQHQAASAPLGEAEQLFARIGAVPDLEQVRSVLAELASSSDTE